MAPRLRVLFPSRPYSPAEPDPAFGDEIAAAEAAGLPWSLYALEEARGGAPTLRRWPEGAVGDVLHRGWMLTGEEYARLADAVATGGGRLVVSAEAYAEAHYLPLAYAHLRGETFESVWNASGAEDDAWALYQQLADHDVVMKDWVKSAKHRWREACLVRAHTDRERFGEQFRAFRAERGRLFNRGVVLRRAHPLLRRGTDMRGMPIHEERRLFFWRGELLATNAEPGEGGPLGELGRWRAVARRFGSPFLTLDVALEESGRWVVVESGDGGVSGLPLDLPAVVLFRALAAVTSGAVTVR